MWESSNLNSDSALWPPDAAQERSSMVYPTSAIPYVCPFTGILFPGLEIQGSLLEIGSTCLPVLNSPAPTSANNSEPEAAKTKRFLAFEPYGNQKVFVFSSTAKPFDDSNPTLLARNATSVYSFNDCIIGEDEMHEDTEEIDALLYSESEYSYNDEESSTGHSPLDVEEEEFASFFLPAKRRRVDSSGTEAILMDTASSAIFPSFQYIPEDDPIDLSFVSCIGEEEETLGHRGRNCHNKREKIQATVRALRRIIPGGKGKDTASVLEEAIQYLKSLKLRVMAVCATSSAL